MSTRDHVAVRLDHETLTRIDAITALLDTEWRDATRSDVLRLLILKGLTYFEKKHRAELDRQPASAPNDGGGVTPRRGRRGAKATGVPARRSRKRTPRPVA
jgi:hypothetical protein